VRVKETAVPYGLMDDFIRFANFIVGIAALGVLVWYAIETWKLRKAAEAQIVVSHDLLKAANDQAEGMSRPCLTIRPQLRDMDHTLLHMDGAVGGTVVRDEAGHYVALNQGNGLALNVQYLFRVRPDADAAWKDIVNGYLQTVQPGEGVQMALMVNAYGGDHEITFRFQSLGGRWYESIVLIESRVLTKLTFAQLPPSFDRTSFRPI
jgi:hypothetical protein